MRRLPIFIFFMFVLNAGWSWAFFPPNHVSKTTQISQLRNYYVYWKNKYLKSLTTTSGKQYSYVAMQGVGPDGDQSITSSEAHGYGMILLVVLSEFDPQARMHFDNFVRLYNDFRSTENRYNMSWIVHKNLNRRYASATDGDLDIAYALLLAHKKWGSTTTFNYLTLAQNLIRYGIKISDFSSSGRTDFGDWDFNRFHSRSSDWMPSHFQTFYKYTGDSFWLNAITTVYGMVQTLQSQSSPTTGLLPDFVVGATPQPAPYNYLDEGTVDYSWNACRYPLRLALDAVMNKRSQAQSSLNRTLPWLMRVTGGNPVNLRAGYFLNGQPQVNYTSAAFVAPWVVAASTNASYQSFVNRGWDSLQNMKYDYYSDSISLLALSFLGGLWTAP